MKRELVERLDRIQSSVRVESSARRYDATLAFVDLFRTVHEGALLHALGRHLRAPGAGPPDSARGGGAAVVPTVTLSADGTELVVAAPGYARLRARLPWPARAGADAGAAASAAPPHAVYDDCERALAVCVRRDAAAAVAAAKAAP